MTMKSWTSEGPRPIPSPLSGLKGVIAHDIYMHCYDHGGRQLWRATKNSDEDPGWVEVHLTINQKVLDHPIYGEYGLHVSNENWARWLLKKTISTYKYRAKVRFGLSSVVMNARLTSG